MAYLVVLRGPNAGSRTRLVGDQARIGRDPHNDLVLNDPAVSPRHAVVRRNSSGRFLIEDQMTSTGTRLNGEFVAAGELNDGATIAIGPMITLRFLDAAGTRAADARPSGKRQPQTVEDAPPLDDVLGAAIPAPAPAPSGPPGRSPRPRRTVSDLLAHPETESHAVLDATKQALDSYHAPSRTRWPLIALMLCVAFLLVAGIYEFACR
jgi:hypothetical protein